MGQAPIVPIAHLHELVDEAKKQGTTDADRITLANLMYAMPYGANVYMARKIQPDGTAVIKLCIDMDGIMHYGTEAVCSQRLEWYLARADKPLRICLKRSDWNALVRIAGKKDLYI